MIYGIPSYTYGTPPGRGALRTACGLGMIADSFELKIGYLMGSTVTKASAVELLETIGFIEDHGPVVGLDGLYMVKIAALRTIALPTPFPTELKGIAV